LIAQAIVLKVITGGDTAIDSTHLQGEVPLPSGLL
jgi:hypothetical protein